MNYGAFSNPATACPGGILYAVRPGQTLAAVGRLFSVAVKELIAANPYIIPTNIHIGQIICVPGVAERLCPIGRLRIIRSGESLFSIAQETGIPLNTLITNNAFIPNPNLIYPGEQICLPFMVPSVCSLILEGTPKANTQAYHGVSLIEISENGDKVTVTAIDLPAPADFGDFNTYHSVLAFRETERLIPLEKVAIAERPILWTGSEAVDVPPLGANLIAVFPFDTATENRGPDVLRGLISNCRNATAMY